jgi:thiamine pyrophosphokinase
LRAVIFANGELHHPDLDAARLRPDDWLIAADGGARHARALGVTPHVLIGDFDSVDPAERARLEALGVDVQVFPARKDETDLELALRLALARAGETLVLGALGARWDQTLANVLLLALPGCRGRDVRLADGAQELRLATPSGGLPAARVHGAPGDTLSLIPLLGDARGVTTRGLEYPLHDGVLPFGATLGVSNVLVAPDAEIEVREGLVLVVHIKGEQ